VRKIYYVPGLISAILIPLLFWYYGNQKFEEINVSVVDIGLPAKVRKETSSLYVTFEPYRNWEYKKINILPGTAKDHSKLYVSELKNLQKKNEKNTGIEFILNNDNTYGDFVSVLNDMNISNHEQYAVDMEKTGHIFATVLYKDPNVKESEYECLLCNDVLTTEYKPDFFEKMQSMFTILPQNVYYFVFGFLLFLNLSMLSIKERFQLQH